MLASAAGSPKGRPGKQRRGFLLPDGITALSRLTALELGQAWPAHKDIRGCSPCRSCDPAVARNGVKGHVKSGLMENTLVSHLRAEKFNYIMQRMQPATSHAPLNAHTSRPEVSCTYCAGNSMKRKRKVTGRDLSCKAHACLKTQSACRSGCNKYTRAQSTCCKHAIPMHSMGEQTACCTAMAHARISTNTGQQR